MINTYTKGDTKLPWSCPSLPDFLVKYFVQD